MSGTVALALVLGTAAAFAVPDGLEAAESRLNVYTTGVQRDAAAANTAGGGFIVVWSSQTQDGGGAGIYGRRVDSAGVPMDAEFRVTADTAGERFRPIIAMRPPGGVVVWQSEHGDGSRSGIVGRRLDAQGAPEGPEFRVNTYTTGQQTSAVMAMNAAGDFLVAWESQGQDGSYTGIFAQAFDAHAGPRGAEFRVNTSTISAQNRPATVSSGGEFVVVWQSRQDDGTYDVFGQRFDARGHTLGGEFRVTGSRTTPATTRRFPQIDAVPAGGFVVLWQAYMLKERTATIMGRRLDRAGTPMGAEFQVSPAYPSVLVQGNVAATEKEFMAVWYGPSPGGGSAAYGRCFLTEGQPLGAAFRIGTSRETSVEPAAIAAAQGGWLLTWLGNDPAEFVDVYVRRVSSCAAAGETTR